RTQSRLPQPVSVSQVDEEFTIMRERAERVFEYALPHLATLALSLTPQQIASIERKFASNNEKFRKETLRKSPAEQRQARYEKVMKQAEYWFGKFDAAQKERIRAASDARPMDYEIWMQERLRRQRELIAFLKKVQAERPARHAVEGMLRAYMGGVLHNFTYTENKPFFDASRHGMAEMTAQIINLATPAQKAHANRRLQSLIDDGHKLAGIRSGQQVSLQER
ncbi:MAG TPA: DUF6279 family lipoprotein, partial [Noviherbaspirillum sp.]|nr:DUF6279 family lipoprotein [Noviherbaspirillum sp.]